MKLFKLLFILLSTSWLYGQNNLKIKDITAGPGDEAKIVLSLDNSDAVSGFQFKITVPEGLTVKEREVKYLGRGTDHVIYPKRISNREFLFLSYSAKGENITGNSGDLIEIPIQIPLTYSVGQSFDISFTENLLSSSAGQSIAVSTSNGNLNIVEGKTPDLAVSSISVQEKDLIPGALALIKWTTSNVGNAATEYGWREQISLVSSTGKKHIIGNHQYDNSLIVGGSLAREKEITLPQIIGFDGDVKVQVEVIPYNNVKELLTNKANNTAESTTTFSLKKKLFITLNKQEIDENSVDQIQLNVVRSGDNSKSETFTLENSLAAKLQIPTTIVIGENQSSNFIKFAIKDNETYEGNETALIKVSGANYLGDETKLLVKDNESIILSIQTPENTPTTIGSIVPITISASFARNTETVINLSTDKIKRFQLPSTVTLPANSKSVSIDGKVLDPGVPEKKETINLFASATQYISATKTLDLSSVNISEIELSFSSSKISERDGYRATYATLKRKTNSNYDANYTFVTDKKDQLILPTSVPMAKGLQEITFAVGVVNNGTVDGSRNVEVTALLQFESCNFCTDKADASTLASKSIEILDDDGLAIALLAKPSTIKAGNGNNTLKVSRNVTDNSILANPLKVTLTNDKPSIVEIPNEVTIPANQSEIDITFNTKIDTALKGDQTVRIEGTSNGYADGFAWVLITDQNKADITIDNIAVDNNITAGSKIKVQSTLKNIGNVDFPAGTKLNYYLSKTNSISDVIPFATSIVNMPIKANESIEFSEEIQLPQLSGNLNLIASINPEKSVDELNFDNNTFTKNIAFGAAYTVDVSLVKKTFKIGEIVKIEGTAKNSSGTPVPNSAVEIKITNGSFVRTYTQTTNASGKFAFDFTPLDTENGHYTIAAAYPGTSVTPQENFDILGFEIVDKSAYIKWEPLVGSPLQKEIKLKNNTSKKLTNIKFNLTSSEGFTLSQTPITIEPYSTASLIYTISATQPSAENKYTEIPFALTSDEGAELKDLIYYHSKLQEGKLIAQPISINTTMIKDQSRIYEFSVKNEGAVAAEKVEIKLPKLDWMQLSSATSIDKIEPNEEIKISLELKPTIKEQLNVPITGSIAISQNRGNTLSIPFRIETVSEASGKLIVDAVDEYTYNTASAPHLSGAKVVVKHPFTGQIIAEGITNEKGLFEVPTIQEGWYTVVVSADKHTPYQNNIQVDPGKTNTLTAFLPYNAISYTWDVIRKDIDDEYEIKLKTQFETNVPKPVIVMELDNNKLDDIKEGEQTIRYLTVTNHGLISAYKVNINVGDVAGYTIKPLISNLEELSAKTTKIIPILISRLSNNTGKTTVGGDCQIPVNLRAVYLCDTEKEIFSFTFMIKGGCNTTPRPIPITFNPGPGYPGGYGGCTSCGPYSSSYTVTEFPDICDPCTKQIIYAGLGCSPIGTAGTAIVCAIEVLTSTSLWDLFQAGKGCVENFGKKLKCLDTIKDALKTCIEQFLESKFPIHGKNANAPKGKWDYIRDDFEFLSNSQEATISRLDEYFQNPTLRENSADFQKFISLVENNLTGETIFTAQQIAEIKSNTQGTSISSEYIDNFTNRWNNTLKAWSEGVFSPNSTYNNIVDKEKLKIYEQANTDLKNHVFERGFVSVQEMYTSDLKNIEDFGKELQNQSASACATITLEFPQKLTMTREAFEGTLKINNSSSKNISKVNLDLVVTDANGNVKTNLFQINKEAFLSGTGNVGPSSNGQGLVTFIPTKDAAPQVATTYGFGGILSYFDEDLKETVFITLNPVYLEVSPSPDLVLHYFMQRNILGDDALTEDIIEPTLPAEMSLLIYNDGYGAAKNVQVESMQPKILDNVKGLLIDFKMIGSNLNNQPSNLGLLNVNFGDIQPKKATVGQWWFTSSLMGHFVSYDVKVNHTKSYGNDRLSLIKEANIHELIKSIKSYGNTYDDNILDFLVNDVSDANDTPDRIYLSNGNSEEVFGAEKIEVLSQLSSNQLSIKLKVNPSSNGWNYGNINDPGNNQYKLEKVVRDNDNVEIPLENFWQTYVTLKDGLNPKYENKLHILDKINAISTYTLFYKPIDNNIPSVVEFIDVPSKTNTPVETVKVKFNKEIDVNTFTNKNITLIVQGKTIDTSKILIGKIDETTYSINVKDVTLESGYYELTVSTLGIKDLLGNEGLNGKKTNWIQFINELGIIDFQSDQVKKQPLNTVNVIFTKKIRSEEFTKEKVLINGQIQPNIVITPINDLTYAISGIKEYNTVDGDYKLTVKLTEITSEEGAKGIVDQSYEWSVNTSVPEITKITAQYQGSVNNQNVTGFDVILNKKVVNNLEAANITLYRNNQKVDATFTVTKYDPTTFEILNIGSYTTENGNYKLVIDQQNLKDENDNLAVGTKEYTWNVNVTNTFSGVNNVRVSPDRGISSTDNITSGNDVKLHFTTLKEQLEVSIYEVLATQNNLIETVKAPTNGDYSIALTGKYGSKKFLIKATDANGNSSEDVTLSAYIDNNNFETTINSVKLTDNICSGADYVEVKFSEAIDPSSFTKNAIIINSSGITMSSNSIIITKVTDTAYRIDNLPTSFSEKISVKIDNSQIRKNLSGYVGSGSITNEIGYVGGNAAQIVGDLKAVAGTTYKYVATSNLEKYDWLAINGEIVGVSGNVIEVKWLKEGSQTLILKYVTSSQCVASTVLNVEVDKSELATVENKKKSIKVAPIPNNGQFTIFTGTPLKDATIEIYNLAGSLIYKKTNINIVGSHEVNITGKPSGMYIMMLHNQETKHQFKFIIK